MKNNELKESSTRLYVFEGEFENQYFDTKEELLIYYNNSHDSLEFVDISIVEYLGQIGDKNDVIRRIYPDETKLYAICDETQFYVCDITSINNPNTSNLVWSIHEGSLDDIYSAFRNRGIVFKDDIYQRVFDESNALVEIINDTFKKFF